MRAAGSPSSWPSSSSLVKIGRPGASSPNSAASSSSALDGTCWGSSRTSFIVPLLSWVVGPLAPSRGSSPCRAQRGKKKARKARAIFPLPAAWVKAAGRGGPGATGQGVGSHDGSIVPASQPPPVPPTGRVSGGRGRVRRRGSWGPTGGRQWRAGSCLGRVRAVCGRRRDPGRLRERLRSGAVAVSTRRGGSRHAATRDRFGNRPRRGRGRECHRAAAGGDSLGDASGSCPAVVRTARETAKWPRFEGME